MGGIKTDIYGKTAIEGLFACGECACNGIHGANRLASNSLLEGLVFGRIIGEETTKLLDGGISRKEKIKLKYSTKREPLKDIDKARIKAGVQQEMTENVGIIRCEEGLNKALRKITEYEKAVEGMKNETVEDFELQNIILLSKLIIKAALERKESRGAHYRTDYPSADDERWKRHIIMRNDIAE